MAWLVLFHAYGGVVINEFVADPHGADGGFEWVELHNDGASEVDVTGWTIEKATSSFGNAHTLGTLSIPAGGYLLIGESHVPDVDEVATLAFGNAGSSGDALRLLDASHLVIDTVVYGSDNSDGFLDDTGATATSFAPIASGTSTARVPNGSDSDQSGTDFILLATPSPKADNSSTLPSCDGATGLVKINEFLADPAGADADNEWVEIYNSGSTTIDLSGWSIAAGTSSFNSIGTLPDPFEIAPQEHVLIGQTSASGATVLAPGFSLGNASNADAVQLRDCLGGVADTVVYGTDNSDGWLDDNGLPATLAPVAGSGQSIGRTADGVDTDASDDDFVVFATPSPGATNVGGVGPIDHCDPAAGSGVVINELVPDPAGSDADNEWLELFNTGSATVDISGWRIAAGTSTFGTGDSIGGPYTLAPGAFFVVGQSVLTTPDALAPFTLGNASNADGVQLQDCQGLPADTVIYGTHNTDEWMDDTGNLASLAPKPGSGQAIARIPDGQDSDLSANDFVVMQPTRGLSNTAPPPDCGAFGAGLVVNEFLTNPAGTDDGLEWVELYHGGSAVLDLEGWELQSAGSATWSTKVLFEAGETVSPGDFLLVGGELVPNLTHTMTGSLGNGSGGDGLRVVDCSGLPSDVVVYGGNNDDGVLDESGLPANTVAPTPPEGGSVQRVIDGYDTGTNNLDFAVSEAPTPGLSNLEITPIECVPSAGGVRINELLPDPDGSDDGLEWFELYNSGTSAQQLDGWAFSAGTADYDDRDIVLPGGIQIEAGAWMVIGGDLVEEVDLILDFTLPNGSTSRDGLRMFDCEGSVVDTVIYGALEEEEFDAGIVDDNGDVVASYGDPSGAQSLFRVADGVDTDSGDDWAVGFTSPGESNVVAVGPPNNSTGPGCGCGGGAPDGNAPGGGPNGEAPQGGCSTLPSPTLAFAWTLLVALRRRRTPVA